MVNARKMHGHFSTDAWLLHEDTSKTKSLVKLLSPVVTVFASVVCHDDLIDSSSSSWLPNLCRKYADSSFS